MVVGILVLQTLLITGDGVGATAFAQVDLSSNIVTGIVITNNHVIANAEDILIRVGDKEYNAEVIGADPYMDLAVLKMKNKR